MPDYLGATVRVYGVDTKLLIEDLIELDDDFDAYEVMKLNSVTSALFAPNAGTHPHRSPNSGAVVVALGINLLRNMCGLGTVLNNDKHKTKLDLIHLI
jgi:hypothetical protein